MGQTQDLESRFLEHSSGRVRSTKVYRPWKMIYHENYETRAEAMAREHYLKTPAGRKFLSNLIEAIASE